MTASTSCWSRLDGTAKLHCTRAAQARLAASRPPAAVVEANLLHAGSPSRFAALLAGAAFHIRGARWARARQTVPEFVRRLRVTPTVSFGQTGNPRFSFDAALGARELDEVVSDVYALLAEERGRRPAALVLDEFQAVDLVGPQLPNLLKGLADEHPAVSLVLAGSKRHLMERLVSHREAPLYGMAQRITLGPIPEPEMAAYLVARATAGGRPMDDTAARYILGLAGPVPNDVQHLAYDSFEAATNRVDRGPWTQAWPELLHTMLPCSPSCSPASRRRRSGWSRHSLTNRSPSRIPPPLLGA